MAQIKQNIILLSVSQYCITNEKTGEVENNGCTVRYILTEDMSNCEDKARSIKGYRPAKVTLPFENFDNFNVVPALYEVGLSYNVDSKGNATLAPTDFKFLNGISVIKNTVGTKLNINTKES